jgi:hypothetical protein
MKDIKVMAVQSVNTGGCNDPSQVAELLLAWA